MKYCNIVVLATFLSQSKAQAEEQQQNFPKQIIYPQIQPQLLTAKDDYFTHLPMRVEGYETKDHIVYNYHQAIKKKVPERVLGVRKVPDVYPMPMVKQQPVVHPMPKVYPMPVEQQKPMLNTEPMLKQKPMSKLEPEQILKQKKMLKLEQMLKLSQMIKQRQMQKPEPVLEESQDEQRDDLPLEIRMSVNDQQKPEKNNDQKRDRKEKSQAYKARKQERYDDKKQVGTQDMSDSKEMPKMQQKVKVKVDINKLNDQIYENYDNMNKDEGKQEPDQKYKQKNSNRRQRDNHRDQRNYRQVKLGNQFEAEQPLESQEDTRNSNQVGISTDEQVDNTQSEYASQGSPSLYTQQSDNEAQAYDEYEPSETDESNQQVQLGLKPQTEARYYEQAISEDQITNMDSGEQQTDQQLEEYGKKDFEAQDFQSQNHEDYHRHD